MSESLCLSRVASCSYLVCFSLFSPFPSLLSPPFLPFPLHSYVSSPSFLAYFSFFSPFSFSSSFPFRACICLYLPGETYFTLPAAKLTQGFGLMLVCFFRNTNTLLLSRTHLLSSILSSSAFLLFFSYFHYLFFCDYRCVLFLNGSFFFFGMTYLSILDCYLSFFSKLEFRFGLGLVEVFFYLFFRQSS